MSLAMFVPACIVLYDSNAARPLRYGDTGEGAAGLSVKKGYRDE